MNYWKYTLDKNLEIKINQKKKALGNQGYNLRLQNECIKKTV